MTADRANALVIGAGPAGAVVALRLAQAGLSVVCLEQGTWPDRDLYRGAEPEWELVTRKQMSYDPNVRGMPSDYPVRADESDITPLMWNGVGGSTILYNACFPRMVPSDFCVRSLDGVADDWPLGYAELAPYYRRVETDFGVSGLSGDPAYPPEDDDMPLPPLPLGKLGYKVARAHNELGWHWWPEANAIPSRPYRGRNACAQRGTCTAGCPEGAKATADVTHWPEASRLGVRLLTGARVTRICTDDRGLATGAEYLDRSGGLHLQRADTVFLAANGIGTARLLLLSAGPQAPDGLANSSGLVGRRLMMHPFAVVTGLFEENLESWQGQFGAAISSYQFYETDLDRGFVRGAKWALAPSGGPLLNALPLRSGDEVWGAEHHVRFRERFGHGAGWAIFGEDLPEDANRVTLDPAQADGDGLPGAAVSYRISPNSTRLIDYQIARASESLQAAGAHSVEVGRLLRYSGWHLMGTTRMGADPASSVVDPAGRCHDVPNLFVTGASVFVTSGAVNPTNTLCALSLRTAELALAGRSDQPVPA
jgi:choline dehydrogenase-like flavoprotein